jgi:hypothetical protein
LAVLRDLERAALRRGGKSWQPAFAERQGSLLRNVVAARREEQGSEGKG